MGAPLQAGEAGTDNTLLWVGAGAELVPCGGEGRVCPGAGRGCLRGSARPFGGVECSAGGHAQDSAFAPGSSEMAVTFLRFFCLSSIFVPAVQSVFSPRWFLCISLLEETWVQVHALQQRVPGPRSQPEYHRLRLHVENVTVLVSAAPAASQAR